METFDSRLYAYWLDLELEIGKWLLHPENGLCRRAWNYRNWYHANLDRALQCDPRKIFKPRNAPTEFGLDRPLFGDLSNGKGQELLQVSAAAQDPTLRAHLPSLRFAHQRTRRTLFGAR